VACDDGSGVLELLRRRIGQGRASGRGYGPSLACGGATVTSMISSGFFASQATAALQTMGCGADMLLLRWERESPVRIRAEHGRRRRGLPECRTKMAERAEKYRGEGGIIGNGRVSDSTFIKRVSGGALCVLSKSVSLLLLTIYIVSGGRNGRREERRTHDRGGLGVVHLRGYFFEQRERSSLSWKYGCV